jgi:putative endonuclease
MFCTYVLVSEFKGLRFYVGISSDIENRLTQHNSGKTKSTKGYRPWRLFFFEEYKTSIEARGSEIYLKSGTGKEKIKRMWNERARNPE